MEQNDLAQIRTWFERYVASYYSDDPVTRSSFKSRYDHILRTCQEMTYLTGALGLEKEEACTAQAIALLHDIGRFEQFARYGTFFDHVSTDHGNLGAIILGQTGALAHLTYEEQETIASAVRCHNRRALPGNLPDSHQFFARLIRDADKLDIFKTAFDYYQSRQSASQDQDWELELYDEPTCSPEILNALLTGQQIEYCDLQTIHDMQLAQIAWIYDVQFAPTYRRLQDRQVLEQLIGLLPEDSPRDQIRQNVTTHIKNHINAVLV